MPILGCPSKCHIYGRLPSNTAVVGCSEKPLKKKKKKKKRATGRRVLNVLHLHKHREAETSCLPPSQSGSHAKTTCPERQENNTESLTGTVRGKGRAADRRKVVAVLRLACFAPHACARLTKYIPAKKRLRICVKYRQLRAEGAK